MMYLEDFLELIEGLPQELKSKTDHVLTLDSSIHKGTEKVEEDIDVYFSNAKKMKPQERQSNHEKILGQYCKLLGDSQEKSATMKSMRESLDRYMKKLDQELEKFKCELEADSPGITEVLERRSLELDEPLKDSQKENRYNNLYSRGSSNLASTVSDWRTTTNSIKKEDLDLNFLSNMSLSPPPPPVSYSLGIGSGNVIAAAASQAIAATQQMRQGRKSTSLSNSYDNLSHGVFPSDLSLGNEIAHAAKAALAASSLSQESSASNSSSASMSTTFTTKKQKKTPKLTSLCSSLNSILTRDLSPCPSEEIQAENVMDPMIDNQDWTLDPNEPRYCICNQVSYGDMVACDNVKCPLEWFHYPCVGITGPPKGKWYCPDCIALNRRLRK